MSIETDRVPDLPKWPALIVKGEDVSPEQAAQIIVRTTEISFLHSNDKTLEARVKAAFGLPEELSRDDRSIEAIRAHFAQADAVRERLGILSLHYLTNSQIVSSYVGGPHGWVDWRGHVGTSSYNIGKWPSVKDVEADWTAIAEAFPFLRLEAQLLSGEQCEDGTKPLVEFVVHDGKVRTIPFPERLLGSPTDGVDIDLLSVMLSHPGLRESGCTIGQLRTAIALTEEAVSS